MGYVQAFASGVFVRASLSHIAVVMLASCISEGKLSVMLNIRNARDTDSYRGLHFH